MLRRQGIIFLIFNYNHIKSAWRAADSKPLGSAPGSRNSSSGGAAPPPADPRPSSPTAVRGGLGLAGAAALKECEDQLATCTSLFVEDQLGAHFKELVEFVKKAEQTQKRLAVPDGKHIPGGGGGVGG